MVNPPRHKQEQDFDANTLVKEHGEDISELKARILELENKFGSNEKIAETLCDTSLKAVKMREMLAKTFVETIKTDAEVKAAIEQLVKNTDKHTFWGYMKIGGGILWTAVSFILGLLANNLPALMQKK